MNRCRQVSAVVLCYNEAPNIRHCLESVKDFCEIYVVDSGSTDGTVEICREYTDKLFQNAYKSHADQWQWALQNLSIETDWVLALDADFTVSERLKDRMANDLMHVSENVAGIYVRHLYHFGGSLIRFGGTKQYWLRLIRRGRAWPDPSEMVDFRFVADGQVLRWKESVFEYNRHDDDISTWLAKQDKFSLRLAVEEELRRSEVRRWSVHPRFFGHTDERIAWLRDRWLHLPLYFRPVLYFIYRYFFALGFLDGRGGFLYAALQGFWLRLIVDWKTVQIRQARLTPTDLMDFAELVLTGRGGSVAAFLTAFRAQNVTTQERISDTDEHS